MGWAFLFSKKHVLLGHPTAQLFKMPSGSNLPTGTDDLMSLLQVRGMCFLAIWPHPTQQKQVKLTKPWHEKALDSWSLPISLPGRRVMAACPFQLQGRRFWNLSLVTNWCNGQIGKFSIRWKTLPKAQRTRGLSSAYQRNFFRSYHKFLHKSWSNIFRISTKHQLQNLNQTSAFRQNLNLKILTKPNFRILTKIELHNHNSKWVGIGCVWLRPR